MQKVVRLVQTKEDKKVAEMANAERRLLRVEVRRGLMNFR
jgi:hypothetical protein